MKRTDLHRPGAIVPADYEPVLSYSLPTSEAGWPIPSIGLDCASEYCYASQGVQAVQARTHLPSGRCCVRALEDVAKLAFVATGGVGQCSVCGARFVYGDAWQHTPTGALLHVGHDCADKYQLLMDRSAWELENGRVRQAAASALIKARNAEERAAFLAANPGLEAAFALAAELGAKPGTKSSGLAILLDLEARLRQWRSLSEKQVTLALKLADELRRPRAEEAHVPAPEGRLEVEGRIVSVKSYESDFGTSWKMTVKVETPAGSWLAWGTVPAAIDEARKGDVVRFTATLKQGRDAHFALFKRPSKAAIVRRAEALDNVTPS